MSTDASASAAATVRHAVSGSTMGTRWSAVFYAATGLATADLAAGLQASVDTVDTQMSTWKPDSDLMQFNRAPVGEWARGPRPLCEVVATALAIGSVSGGAFDIGVGGPVSAWGFGPDAGLGATECRAIGVLDVDCDRGLLRRRADVSIDLSGIAKGYGVDALAAVLAESGITDYLVAIDGDMRAAGSKPGGRGWTVGIERPLLHRREVAHVVSLGDMAMATSGNYRRWREHEGGIVAHTIDPATGAPVCNRVASVTVAAETCTAADAWATALMVLGEEAGPAKAHELELDALFMIRADGGGAFLEMATGAFVDICGGRQPRAPSSSRENSGQMACRSDLT